MSRTVYPRLKEFNDVLYAGATTSQYALHGRVVPVTYPNPKYQPTKPVDEKNVKMRTDLVPLTAEGIRSALGLTLLGTEPLTFCLKPQCSVTLPTGVLVNNKEVKYEVREADVGQEPFYHGKPVVKPKPVTKDLSQYFLGETA